MKTLRNQIRISDEMVDQNFYDGYVDDVVDQSKKQVVKYLCAELPQFHGHQIVATRNEDMMAWEMEARTHAFSWKEQKAIRKFYHQALAMFRDPTEYAVLSEEFAWAALARQLFEAMHPTRGESLTDKEWIEGIEKAAREALEREDLTD